MSVTFTRDDLTEAVRRELIRRGEFDDEVNGGNIQWMLDKTMHLHSDRLSAVITINKKPKYRYRPGDWMKDDSVAQEAKSNAS